MKGCGQTVTATDFDSVIASSTLATPTKQGGGCSILRKAFYLFAFSVGFFVACVTTPEPSVREVIRIQYVPKVVTVYVEKEPERVLPYYSVTSEERELLARVLWVEGRGEPEDCQEKIVSVIMNRISSCGTGSVADVIYAKAEDGTPQFDSSSMVDDVTPTETQYNIVDRIITNGPTVPGWVQYFRANRHHTWSKSYTPYCSSGNTYFGGFKP